MQVGQDTDTDLVVSAAEPGEGRAADEGDVAILALVARWITAPPGRFQRQTRLPSTMRQGPAITSFSGTTTTSFVGATTTSFFGATTTSLAGSATGLRTSTAPSRPTQPACRTPSAHSTATALLAAAVMSTAAVRDTTRLFIFVLQSIEWLESNRTSFSSTLLAGGCAWTCSERRVKAGEKPHSRSLARLRQQRSDHRCAEMTKIGCWPSIRAGLCDSWETAAARHLPRPRSTTHDKGCGRCRVRHVDVSALRYC